MEFVDEVPDNFWEGKRVLLRVGFDMGKEFSAMEDFRIQAGLPTIDFLARRKARLVLLNHNGRPGGKMVPGLSNKKIAAILASRIQQTIPLLSLDATPPFSQPLVFLENLRFDPGEEKADPSFTKKLAAFGDIYVNDAFSNSHRAHASMIGIPTLLPHFGGLLLKRELEALREARDYPLHPLILILGGLKAETKIKIIKKFLSKAQAIMLGGVLANTVLHKRGIAIGKSLIDLESLRDIEGISLTDTRLHLPVDVRSAKDFEGSEERVAPVGKLLPEEIILDVGPDTQLLFDNIIKSAKMVIWNGPMGKCELPVFSQGTKSVAHSLFESKAKVITGGGETVEFLYREGVLDKFYFVSTGGGAMLSFLAGEEMPGLEALEN